MAILKTNDLRRTEDWYAKVGLMVRGRRPESAPTWCELERNGTVLQFLAGETPWHGAPALTGCLYVHCEDIDDGRERTQSGRSAVGTPVVPGLMPSSTGYR